MKVLVLAALIAVVSSGPLSSNNWPWKLDTQYVYDVKSYTYTKFDENSSNGNSFDAQLVIRVKTPGTLLAKLVKPRYASVPAHHSNDVPTDLKYQPVEELTQPFEITVDGGRIVAMKVPTALPTSLENLLKGIVSAMQVDLSFKEEDDFNTFNKEKFQGLLKSIESDVTGTCETLYTVSPVSAEWHRDLQFYVEEDVVEIVKSKNYGRCTKPFFWATGLPEGAKIGNDGKQLIKFASEARILAGKQGTIYRSEFLTSVYVNPLMFGKQKAEVKSFVKLYLKSVEQKATEEWKVPEGYRQIDSMYYTVTKDFFNPLDEENVPRAQKLLQELTTSLQTPSNLSKSNFLSKFNVLVRFLLYMSPQQLTTMTKYVETASSKTMWIVYRDAVAQAGSHNCFKEIKTWILNKKIQGEEAAEVFASLPSVIRWRTNDIVKEFYEFALNPVVMEQEYLNSTALLAAAKFITLAKDFEAAEKFVEPLSEGLKKAVEVGDSSKADTYIRVIGNIAHPYVLKAFEPYLEGRIVVSKYLRTQMVISLKTLANLKDDRTRGILFSILRNSAEAYEVRVAAVLNIFMAVPTPEMMQIMAHMTNDDPSTQVRAAITTGIVYAAKLKDPRFAELAKTAQSVFDIVSKEKFGYRLSTNSLIDSYSSKEETGHFREISYIGSKNNQLPLYERMSLRFRNNGLTEEDWFTFSVSDMQQLLNYIAENFIGTESKDVDFKFSAKKIIEALNIKRAPQTPLQGSLFIDQLNQQRLFTFTEEELTAYIKGTIKNMQEMMTGSESQYIKIVHSKQVFVVLPLAMGMPFTYTYSEPTVFVVQSKSKVKLGYEKTSSLQYNIQFTYARNMDGNAGFYDTIGNTLVTRGVINKLQFYIPAVIHTKVKSRTFRLLFELPQQDVDLIHMSVWPYTSLEKFSDVLPVLESPTTRLIERPNKIVSPNTKFGELTGVTFALQGYSYSNDYKYLDNLYYETDPLTYFRHLLYQNDIALTEFDFKYVAKESKNKDVAFTFVYESKNDLKGTGEMGPAALWTDIEPNSPTRREEMAKRVAAGINYPRVQLIDMSAVFDGEQKKEFVFSAALANSYVDRKSQFIFFYRGSQQINAVIKVDKPKIVPMNFEEAMKNEIKATFHFDVKFGNDDNIHIHSIGERSKEFSERLMNEPMAKKCLYQTGKSNFFQMDCYKMIIKAHAPDFFKTTVTYKNMSPWSREVIYGIYDYFKKMYMLDDEQWDVLATVPEGKLEITSQAFYYDEYIHFDIKSQFGLMKMNVAGMLYHVYGMAFYPPLSYWERAYNFFTYYQNMPYCAVDNNKVWTFSGRSYDYSLTSSWHVVMVDEAIKRGNKNDLVILARRAAENQEEVYVSYKTEAGEYVELEITPAAINVKSSAKKTIEGAVTSYTNEDKFAILEYFNLSDNVMVFYINEAAVRFMYDKQRLVIFTADHRSSTNGLCGQSSTEFRDDYMTPFGLVDRPEHYGASWALEGEFSDPKTVELKNEAKLKAYQPWTKYTYIGPQPKWH